MHTFLDELNLNASEDKGGFTSLVS